jgi:tRNA-specific 2-thiouridylase
MGGGMGKRVCVGLSGGVDSAVAAAMLLEQGYEVTGVFITCWSGPGCRSDEDRQDALDVALFLGIPFIHLDFQKAYKERVFEYMMGEYEAGRTPNPDVMCNREIKFGLFYDWALEQTDGKPSGFDFVATGHYAQIGYSSKLKAQSLKQFCLKRSRDEKKDQTYFLHQLRQEQLEHVLFPIGHLTKQAVRLEAQRLGLPNWSKPDSQGICFIGNVAIASFLEKRIEKRVGEIWFKNLEIGQHRGVWFYTIGQKISLEDRSWKIEERIRQRYQNNTKTAGFDTTQLPHFYVIGKDLEHNILQVGTKEMGLVDELVVGEVHWIGKNMSFADLKTRDVCVRIRHGGELVKVKEVKRMKNEVRIKLEKPVWGVAAGQSCVFYEEDVVLGGGVIKS